MKSHRAKWGFDITLEQYRAWSTCTFVAAGGKLEDLTSYCTGSNDNERYVENVETIMEIIFNVYGGSFPLKISPIGIGVLVLVPKILDLRSQKNLCFAVLVAPTEQNFVATAAADDREVLFSDFRNTSRRKRLRMILSLRGIRDKNTY